MLSIDYLRRLRANSQGVSMTQTQKDQLELIDSHIEANRVMLAAEAKLYTLTKAAEPACEEEEMEVAAKEVTTQDLLRGGLLDRFQVTRVETITTLSGKEITKIRAIDHAMGEQRVEYDIKATTRVAIYRQVPRKDPVDELIDRADYQLGTWDKEGLRDLASTRLVDELVLALKEARHQQREASK